MHHDRDTDRALSGQESTANTPNSASRPARAPADRAGQGRTFSAVTFRRHWNVGVGWNNGADPHDAHQEDR